MEYSKIENEAQYEEVTHCIEQLKDAEPGTAGAKELKVLIKMIIDFEKKKLNKLRSNR